MLAEFAGLGVRTSVGWTCWWRLDELFDVCSTRYVGNTLISGCIHEDGTVDLLSNADPHRCVNACIALADEHIFNFLPRLLDDTPSADCERRENVAAARPAQVFELAIR